MRNLRKKGFALVSVVLMLLTPIASVTAQPISPLDSTEIRATENVDGFSTGFYVGVNGGSVTDTANGKKDKGGKKKGGQGDTKEGKGEKGGKNGNNGNKEKAKNGEEKGNKSGEKKGDEKHGNSSSNNSSAPKDPLVNATIDVDEDATALEHRKAVLSVLRNVNAQNGTSKQIERYVTTLNGTLERVLDGNRITSADVFRGDKEVVAPLHERAPQIAEHLVLSDEKLARQVISDAEHASDVLEDRNISYDEAAVSENITAAREAFDRANHVRNRSMPGVIEHYRQAWTHAQRAIDIMDEAAAPIVSIETRNDLPHNGTIESTIAGAIFDVRPHELAAEIEISGSNRTLSLTAETEPATVAEFNTTVTLATQLPNESRVYVVNVSAHDPGIDIAENGYDSEARQDIHADQRRNDVVVLDGDGLPDIYELNVTGTDPYNPDSDATATQSNNSADGIIDGAEDFDNDTLVSYIEFQTGTDPLDNDTDGDKLPDGFEHSWPTLDPATADTNANGRPDSKEDPDNDSLENLREFELGTSILSNDTDRDGLNDSVETQQLGTDPTTADTDDDNLTDSDELDLGTDPLNPDTNGDGIPDGDETYTTTATDDETNVSVQLTGQGNAAKGVEIAEKPDYHNSSDVKKGPVVQISNSTSIENVTVSIPYSESVNSNDEEHLSMFKYNRTSGIWDSINSTVDPKNGTVSATVNSTSHFAVFNESRWNQLTTIEPKEGISFENTSLECEGACTVNESVLVMGQGAETGSVGTFASTGPGLDPDRDDDGVLNDYDNCIDTYNPDQSDSDDDGIGNACDGGGGTDSDNDLITDSSDNCVYTPNQGQVDTDGDGKGDACDGDDDGDSIPDGNDNCSKKVNPGQTDRDGDGLGARCDSDEPIYEISKMNFAIPSEPDVVKLDLGYKIENVESEYYPELIVKSNDGERKWTLKSTKWDLKTVDVSEFKGEIVTVSVDVPQQTTAQLKPPVIIKDTDGDGVYDYLEEQASYYPGLEGGSVTTDPNNTDTDSEGLKDGEEIEYEPGSSETWGASVDDPLTRWISKVYAHPELSNTDGVGLNDFEEDSKGSDPRTAEHFVFGYKIPGIAKPDSTVPMTVEDSNGIPEGGTDNSNILEPVAVNHPECVQKMCTPEWLDPVDVNRDKQYLLVPMIIYAQSNTDGMKPIQYSITITDTKENVRIVGGNAEGEIKPTEGRVFTYVIIETPIGEIDSLKAGFRYLHKIQVELKNVDGTVFARSGPERLSQEYHFPSNVVFEDMDDVLETTQLVYENGITFTFAAKKGYSVTIESQSLAKGTRVAMYEFGKDKINPVPMDGLDYLEAVTTSGISVFEEKLKETENELYIKIFGEAPIRPMGPEEVRSN